MRNQREVFEEILKLIESVDVNEDSIIQSQKLKRINEKLRENVRDEKHLTELFEMLNARALQSEEFIMSLVCSVTSNQCSNFSVNGKLLRHAMLTQLQKNHQNAENMKKEDLSKLYNSIKLLGEFYNKARLQSGSPIAIIGKAMLSLINVELEKELRNICHFHTDEFARTILTQITLNGNMLQKRQKTDIEQVLLTIRKCLIELPTLSPNNKAFLLMILDLYYSNFMNVGHGLERMYQEYLITDKKESSQGIVQNGNAVEVNHRRNESKENTQKPPVTISRESKESARDSKELSRKDSKESPRRDNKEPSHQTRKTTVTNSRKSETRKAPIKPPVDLKIQIPRPTPVRSSSVTSSRYKNVPKTPPRSNSVSPRKDYIPRSPKVQTPSRSVPKSPQSQPAQISPRKKLSPQELRKKAQVPEDSKPAEISPVPVKEPICNGNEETTILRPQNTRSPTPQTPVTMPKLKVDSKVYFREENVENLTWNGEISADIEDAGDPDASTSPKVNPYSSSFLNFLSSN